MKAKYIILSLLCIGTTATAQEVHQHHNHEHPSDSTDVFFRHLKLNELVVTGVTGDTKLKNSTYAPWTHHCQQEPSSSRSCLQQCLCGTWTSMQSRTEPLLSG